MSAVAVAPTNGPRPAIPEAAATSVPFHYTQSESFVALLHQLSASLLVSTYQANKLLVARADGGGLSTLVRSFERPMGLAVADGRLALGTHHAVWLLRNAPDIAARVEPAGRHDACFLPRSCHITGDIAVHELAWALPPLSPEGEGVPPSPLSSGGRGVGDEGELWAVNTRFSCLCTFHPD